MKKILVLLIALSAVLVGCGVSPMELKTNKDVGPTDAFVQMSDNIFCDTEFNIQYIWVYNSNKSGGMSVRLDSNGKPVPCR